MVWLPLSAANGLPYLERSPFSDMNGMSGHPMEGFSAQGARLMPPHPMQYNGPPGRHEVSYDTSSKDPHMLRSRVFIGNLNTGVVTREDIIKLCSPYGTLLGVTVFKGYAFVQFAEATGADFAVSILNGYNWNNSYLDVKLAITGMKGAQSYSTVGIKRPMPCSGISRRGSLSAPSNTPLRDRDHGAPAAKKSRVDESHEMNKKAAKESLESGKKLGGLYDHGMPDTLICGGCRFVTSSLSEFCNHRAAECVPPEPKPVKVKEEQKDESG
ncbi:hypothetical protein QR680_014105 [Steinernema hermaphroditum]|uniref:RRM domain-containing protein n=1 Tax=Steinernema hermaphroditum TaxID=289476 RepID=A0AA39M3M5_9BILA|nr:hypothetical protein QR680_014105 [Steinernema hermaphroditum]